MEYLDNIVNPPPKKLAGQLTANKALQSLPNVQVFSTRLTRSHEDEVLGRRKIIEEEFRRRNLIE
jgi:hypothetical protein